ncbi:MAG: dihydrofolate reductase [Propionibacteriaceae bacterium]|jgi:dihydrofolate reductase|nr:dihydrofolate reductase [Propionibacteriaceae bacterium]
MDQTNERSGARAGEGPWALTAIAAVAANGVIGDGRGMLWRLPEDFARFKRVTMGGVLLQGRHTFDSLGGPLPGRQSIVVTRDPAFSYPGVLSAASPAAALQLLAGFPERSWWSIGGGQLYRALWPYTTDLDLTEVHQSPVGAVLFPTVDPADWEETSRRPRAGFDFVLYRRRSAQAADRLAQALGQAAPTAPVALA